jgi:two-component system phosphate regulon response regulator PhoB
LVFPLIYNDSVTSTIFLLEDDADISELVRHHLNAAGFAVRSYSTATHILADAEKHPPVLFLLDIMVPGGDGFEVCRRIRQSSTLASTPLIFVTAKTAEADRVAGLELGADDYITKPFSPKELIARVKAVLRRFERPLPAVQVRIGDLEIDGVAMRVTLGGTPVETTATEFRLLQYRGSSRPRVYSRPDSGCGLAGYLVCDPAFRGCLYSAPAGKDRARS